MFISPSCPAGVTSSVLVVVGPVLVVAAIAAQELPSAGRTLEDVATGVVQATGEHAVIAAPADRSGAATNS